MPSRSTWRRTPFSPSSRTGRLPSRLMTCRVGAAPYLGGLADTVGELRRYILDRLRRDDFTRCEQTLEAMDEIYTILVTMDFPDAVTRGLRRSTDMVRGILERTRGDLTVALRQQRLEALLSLQSEKSGEVDRN